MIIGKKNISFGWIWILIGIIVGAIMGMWSFNGPLTSPVGDYVSLPRRMLRLSHIAFIALAIINILFAVLYVALKEINITADSIMYLNIAADIKEFTFFDPLNNWKFAPGYPMFLLVFSFFTLSPTFIVVSQIILFNISLLNK